MKKEIYLNYLEDKEVIKIPNGKTAFFKYKNLYIDLSYLHFGRQRVWPSNSKNVRLNVNVFFGNYIPEIPTILIEVETTLLLNPREENLAHAWILKIDHKNSNVSLVLKDYPQVGLSLISDEEKRGLIYNIKIK